MAKSLNDARYTMWATVIPRMVTPGQNVPTKGEAGAFKMAQDEDSGEVITEFDEAGVPDYNKPPYNGSPYDIKCYARGYTALGYRSSANRELWVKGDYQESESIQFDFPKNIVLNRQALITNIRNTPVMYNFLWVDGSTGQPTVWEVQGVTPVMDPFGKWIRNTAVLKRSEAQ